MAAAAGLSVVLATSALAFSVVKFAGAGYLIYLGIKMIVGAERDLSGGDLLAAPKGSPLIQGVFTEILNPKSVVLPVVYSAVCIAARRARFRRICCIGIDFGVAQHGRRCDCRAAGCAAETDFYQIPACAEYPETVERCGHGRAGNLCRFF